MTVLFIIAQHDFRDEELALPKEVVEDAGFDTEVASISTDTAHGMLGMKLQPDLAVKDAKLEDHELIVIVGGKGSPELARHSEVLEFLKEADKMKKALAAICIGPTVLAMAGVLEGIKVTVYRTDQSVKTMEGAGAILVDEPVVRDGRFVTANGPAAARPFGHQLVELLSG